MTVSLILDGLGLALAAAATPVAASHPISPSAPRLETVAVTTAPSLRSRTRDERIGAVALRGFPAAEPVFPPNKSWSMPGGSEVEIGALGSRRSGKADVAHLALALQF